MQPLRYMQSFFKIIHARSKHTRRKIFLGVATCLVVPFLYYITESTCLHAKMKGYVGGGFRKDIERENLIPDYIHGRLINNKTAVGLILNFNNKPVLATEKTGINKPKARSAPKERILLSPRVGIAKETHASKEPIFTKYNQAWGKEWLGSDFPKEPQVAEVLISTEYDSRRIERSGVQLAKESTVPKEQIPTKNSPWSTEWPRVNLENCSTIVYMNRGINSPTNVKNGVYPRTGIVSFPGSGNTWSRQLIQQATGLWTGSVYHDRSLFAGGLLGELESCDEDSTVAIKAHFASLDIHRCTFERAVLVVRDPFRAVLAEFNWRATSKHTGIADKRLYKTEEWSKHVYARSKKWYTSTADWIKRFLDPEAGIRGAESAFTAAPDASTKLLLVSYERLKRNTVQEMERIVKFLGLPVFRRRCIEHDVNGNFHRASRGSESISCLFKEAGMKDAVLAHIRNLLNVTQAYRLGNIVKEFEGLEGDAISDKC